MSSTRHPSDTAARVAMLAMVVVLNAAFGPSAQTHRLSASEPESAKDDSIVMVVSDPLAAELSCPCVAGYAQRDYEQLAEYLGEAIGRHVTVLYGESIARALGDRGKRVDIVIGKQSVVAAEASRSNRALEPVALLTGLDDSSTQHGLVVVHHQDPATGIAELGDHAVVLGPNDCEEKHAAARKLFADNRVPLPADGEIAANCTEAAERVLAAKKAGGRPVAAVVSSYAAPLLEGCGTIRKGELRVVGKTGEVPFIAAFLNRRLDAATRTTLLEALRGVADEPVVRHAIESKSGFRMLPTRHQSSDWPGWRGEKRDGVVGWLPQRLPDSPSIEWSYPLFSEGVGGVAVADGIVIVGDRNLEDSSDVFHAIDAATGTRIWTLEYPAPGNLDYGNSPRATPLVHDGHVFLLGAFGHLHCVRLADGGIVWQRHLRDDFDVKSDLVWGVSSSPLVVDGKLIVNPGAADASLVALAPDTGRVVWKTPGPPSAFASFILARPAGVRQLVGFDATSCGGWDVTNGRRLWSLSPRVVGDFNVPTPLAIDDRVVFVSEQNGTRAIGFGPDGKPRIEAAFARLDPDMHSPVACAGRILGVHKGKVTCLDAETLEPRWIAKDRSFQGHVSLIASDDRVLVCTQHGELILIDALADALTILSRCRVLPNDASTLAHPAVAGRSIYVRGPEELVCVALDTGEEEQP